jgi:micrococcal nuclease
MHIVWLFFISLLAGSIHAKDLRGVVTRVSDGATLWIATSSRSKPFKVRLQGVDAPELCQAWGKQARDALKTRLLRQNVSLQTLARDNYQRTIGRVEHQGTDISQWLVAQGHAWSEQNRYGRGAYLDEQLLAKKQRIGLWSQASPAIEPRQFRQSNGACKFP